MKKNLDIRQYAKQKGVFFWQCAKVLGISEPTMTRRLRFELSEPEKQKLFRIIDELSEQSGVTKERKVI